MKDKKKKWYGTRINHVRSITSGSTVAVTGASTDRFCAPVRERAINTGATGASMPSRPPSHSSSPSSSESLEIDMIEVSAACRSWMRLSGSSSSSGGVGCTECCRCFVHCGLFLRTFGGESGEDGCLEGRFARPEESCPGDRVALWAWSADMRD